MASRWLRTPLMRFVPLLAAFFAAACCSSLPRLSAKRNAFPAPRATHEQVAESYAEWTDAKRGNRVVAVKTYVSMEERHSCLSLLSHAAGTGRIACPPLVIVSHGIGEDRDSYAYLGRALARHGYRAVHITHAGTDKATLARGYRHLYRATKEPQNWIDRVRDVSFVLDRLGVAEAAIAGHSAGAFTAFAAAGMRAPSGESLHDRRIKAIVPMSMPRIAGTYDAIDVPVLNITGTCDTSLIYRTFPRHRRISYESSQSQTLITIHGVNHDAFSAPRDAHHELIAALTIGFLDAHLRGDDAARAWFEEAGNGDALGFRISVERKNPTAR